jgi:hypothetical protein
MGVESGEWKVEWKMDKVESGKLVIEIIKAVVKCSLIASGDHVSPLALVTDYASRAIKKCFSSSLIVVKG